MEISQGPPLKKFTAVFYGDSGSGKTALATAAPAEIAGVDEPIVYVPWDKTSDALDSIEPHVRKRLLLARPTAVEGKDGKLRLDPHTEANAIAKVNYAKQYGAKLIIFDGGTELADNLLRTYANAGVFSGGTGDKHISVGTKGETDYMALPMQGDYGAAQQGAMTIIDKFLIQPINFIFICQSDLHIPENQPQNAVGGPVLTGGKSINRLASRFNTVVRCDVRQVSTIDAKGNPSSKMKYMVYTEKRGVWMAKLRKPVGMPNPIPEVDVTDDTTKFWDGIVQVYNNL